MVPIQHTIDWVCEKIVDLFYGGNARNKSHSTRGNNKSIAVVPLNTLKFKLNAIAGIRKQHGFSKRQNDERILY